jgi:hypothetical protein
LTSGACYETKYIFGNATYFPYAGSYVGSIGGTVGGEGAQIVGAYYTTTVSGSSIAGEWLQVQFPSQIWMTSYSLVGRNGVNDNRIPKIWTIAGSNDGTTWTLVDSQSLATNPTTTATGYTAGTPVNYSITPTVGYTYYRMIINRIWGTDVVVNLFQWNITGGAPPVLYYPFNGDMLNYASGTGVTDMTDGTPTYSTAGLHPSGTGKSVYFNGTKLGRSGLISFPYTTGSGLSISFWLTPNSTTVPGNGYYSHFSLSSGALNSNTLILYTQSIPQNAAAANTQLCYNTTIGGTNYYIPAGTNAAFYTTNWTHIVIVCTCVDSTGTFSTKVYYNNASSGTYTNQTGYQLFSSTYPCNYQTFGHRNGTGDQYYNGYMSNFRLYNRPLTTTEINTIYTNKI